MMVRTANLGVIRDPSYVHIELSNSQSWVVMETHTDEYGVRRHSVISPPCCTSLVAVMECGVFCCDELFLAVTCTIIMLSLLCIGVAITWFESKPYNGSFCWYVNSVLLATCSRIWSHSRERTQALCNVCEPK
ncbi:hypothetical protein P154DRAFT_74306 [Amniculicola lignicola CBS 123094]|uniref:Uncharacterized protein n=1 Tax=Amniculicola lignicola CBS 123094 TaxID=1392246 RepID=A0A6A5WSI8_9PLEO|nr:hypothetical protein P154DRAFT_74306 [Amniculicola lignicola CBS 123094]